MTEIMNISTKAELEHAILQRSSLSVWKEFTFMVAGINYRYIKDSSGTHMVSYSSRGLIYDTCKVNFWDKVDAFFPNAQDFGQMKMLPTSLHTVEELIQHKKFKRVTLEWLKRDLWVEKLEDDIYYTRVYIFNIGASARILCSKDYMVKLFRERFQHVVILRKEFEFGRPGEN